MKRKIYLFFSFIICAVILCFSIMMPKAATYDWEFYPSGINYLDPFNFVTTTNGNDITTTKTYRYIKVKPLTAYKFKKRNEVNVNWSGIYFYEYNQNKELIRTNTFFDFSQGITYSFTTTEETGYLVVEIRYEIETENIYAEQMDKYFILFEETLALADYELEELVYQGPLNNLEVAQENTTIRIPYGNSTSIDSLKSQMRVYDNYCGDITNSVVIELDEYTGQENIVNQYDVIFKVNDNTNNFSSIKVIIDVYDDVAPVITAPNTIYTHPNALLTNEYLLTKVTATDNYDLNLTDSVELINDVYPNSSSVIGIYPVTYRVSDSSNNVSEFTTNINVRDNVAPVITGNNNIEIGNLEDFSLEQIKETLTVTDDIDTNIVLEVFQDNYSLNQHKVGSYDVTFVAKDNSNNCSYYTVTINIIDSEKPVFLFDKGMINIASNIKPITTGDVLLLSSRYYGLNQEDEIIVVYDEYKNSKSLGDHNVLFESGGKKYKLNINVIDDKKTEPTKVDSSNSKLSVFFRKIGNFFSRIWQSIF